ncbi:MAG: MFS transporter [Planctomycetes bacterium]|nr:MFS transporter [Planctomycetota bacterium]
MTEGKTTWRFPRVFWFANGAELLERAAYYGTFIALTLYLSRVLGLSDPAAGWIAGLFGAFIYIFPFLTGAASDRIGFRTALILAFALLTVGYGMLGGFRTPLPVYVGLFLIVLGGSFVKPVISGTVSKCSDATNRARAFSIFYMVVNIGSFCGKTVVKEIREELTVANVPYFSAAASLVALLLVLLFYWPTARDEARPRSVRETLAGMWTAVRKLRFLCLILITAGFWALQGQLYGAMPKYMLRMVGEGAAPEWLANINSVVVVCLVVVVTQWIRKWRSDVSIALALVIVTAGAFGMGMSHLFTGSLNLLGLQVHPVLLMVCLGIALQGLAECFLSPKYLEFASKQAPPGQEGLYLGYSHMNTFFAWLLGLPLSGYLLLWFCPDPTRLSPADQAQRLAALEGLAPMPEAYAHAHYVWYAFGLVGLFAVGCLFVFIFVTRRLDARRVP